MKTNFFHYYPFFFPVLEHFADRLSDEMYPPEKTMAEILHAEDETRTVQMKMSDVPESNKLEKFVEDVRYDVSFHINFLRRQT